MYRHFTDSEYYQSMEIIILSILQVKLENDWRKEWFITVKSIKGFGEAKTGSINLSL